MEAPRFRSSSSSKRFRVEGVGLDMVEGNLEGVLIERHRKRAGGSTSAMVLSRPAGRPSMPDRIASARD